MPSYIVTLEGGKRVKVTTDQPATRDVIRGLLAKPQAPEPVDVPKEPAGTLADLKQGAADVGQRALDVGPEAAGGTVGGMLGGYPGAMGGAGLVRTARVALTEHRLPTQDDLAMPELEALVGEFGSRMLGGIFSKIFGRSSAMAPQDVANAARAQRSGIEALPGDVNPRLSGFEGEIGRTMTGEGTMRNAIQRRGQQTAAAVEKDILQPLGGRQELAQAGESVKDLAMPALRSKKAVGRQYFQQAEHAARDLNIQVDLPAEVTTAADDLLSQLDEGLDSAQPMRAKKIIRELARRGKPTEVATEGIGPHGERLTGMQTLPAKPFTFDELLKMKRDLNEVLPTYEQRGTAKDFSTGALERLHGLLDDTLDKAAAGTPAAKPWQVAKDFWRDEVVPLRKVVEKGVNPKFDDEIVDGLVRANRPEKLRILFKDYERSPEGLQKANDVRAAWFTRALDASSTDGALDPTKFVRRWDNLGSETQSILIGDRQQEVGGLIDVIRGQARSQGLGANPSQTARSVARMGQMVTAGHGAYQAFKTGNPMAATEGALGMFAPWALAQGLTSRAGRRFLTGGIEPGGGLAKTGNWATRAVLQALAQNQGQ